MAWESSFHTSHLVFQAILAIPFTFTTLKGLPCLAPVQSIIYALFEETEEVGGLKMLADTAAHCCVHRAPSSPLLCHSGQHFHQHCFVFLVSL